MQHKAEASLKQSDIQPPAVSIKGEGGAGSQRPFEMADLIFQPRKKKGPRLFGILFLFFFSSPSVTYHPFFTHTTRKPWRKGMQSKTTMQAGEPSCLKWQGASIPRYLRHRAARDRKRARTRHDDCQRQPHKSTNSGKKNILTMLQQVRRPSPTRFPQRTLRGVHGR